MPYIVSQKQNETDDCRYEAEYSLVSADTGTASLPDPARALFPSIEEFWSAGAEAVEKCLARSAPCCLAIIDIDRLQRVTDLHGPHCSEAVLATFAGKLLDLISERDMSAAYLSSDRFGILWSGGAGVEASKTFDLIKRALTAAPIVWQGEEIVLTVSIGVADIRGPETFDNYLNAAEQFLFIAKMSGRNQVVSDHSFLHMSH